MLDFLVNFHFLRDSVSSSKYFSLKYNVLFFWASLVARPGEVVRFGGITWEKSEVFLIIIPGVGGGRRGVGDGARGPRV